MTTKPSPISRLLLSACAALALAGTSRLHAQWATENYQLKAGWNAIWLPLEVPHSDISSLAPSDIEEIWRWNALPDGHFTDVPAGAPSQTDLEWNVWRRLSPSGTTLGRLTGNAAYLVKVTESASPFTWSVKGTPLLPDLKLSGTGVNLVGFPTTEQPLPLSNPVQFGTNFPTFSSFFGLDPVLRMLTSDKINYYRGGALSDVVGPTKNPLAISSLTGAQVMRHQAYWVKTSEFTQYAGPVRVELGHVDGLQFGAERLSVAVRLRNVVDPTKLQTVTVTLAPLASEGQPAGQPAIAGTVPLKIRGNLNLATGQHDFSDFTGPVTRVLAPGAFAEVVFTANRAALGNEPGAVFQSLLKITDSLFKTRIILPVSAVTTSRAGLWGGAAIVTKVDRIVGQSSAPEDAKSNFPVRLLLHSDASGTVRLLQQAYNGEQNGQPAVSASEALFTAPGAAQTRVSSSYFPTGLVQPGTGALGLAGTLTFNVSLGNNEPSNPFLHAYHPDHDNKDAGFSPIAGAARPETLAVNRQIKLTFTSASVAGFDPAWGAFVLGGNYEETVTGLRNKPIVCSGTFLIQRATQASAFLQP